MVEHLRVKAALLDKQTQVLAAAAVALFLGQTTTAATAAAAS
jgi:hypothetical protein